MQCDRAKRHDDQPFVPAQARWKRALPSEARGRELTLFLLPGLAAKGVFELPSSGCSPALLSARPARSSTLRSQLRREQRRQLHVHDFLPIPGTCTCRHSEILFLSSRARPGALAEASPYAPKVHELVRPIWHDRVAVSRGSTAGCRGLLPRGLRQSARLRSADARRLCASLFQLAPALSLNTG